MTLKTTTKRKSINKADWTTLHVKLVSISDEYFQMNEVNSRSIQDYLHKNLMQAIEMCMQTKFISNITKPPWIMSDLDRLIRKKQQLYNKAKKSKAAADWVVYQKSNIKCVSLFECNVASKMLMNILARYIVPQTRSCWNQCIPNLQWNCYHSCE